MAKWDYVNELNRLMMYGIHIIWKWIGYEYCENDGRFHDKGRFYWKSKETLECAEMSTRNM